MEGALGAEDEARDAVLDRLGRVLVLARLLQPLRVLLGLLHREARGGEQRLRLDHRVLGAHDLGRRVHFPQEGRHRAELLLGHQVGLVDEQQVGKLELVAQQVGDGALVALDLLPAAVGERVDRGELLEDRRRVDDGDEVVEGRDVVQRDAGGLVAERERLGDGHRLGDPRRLDEHVVEAALRRERRERREQVLAQRAADAAVRELDHLLLLVQHAAAAHELSVDVDARHVVDDHGDPPARAVVQQVVEQRRLPRAEEAREHRHGQRARAAGLAQEAQRLLDRKIRRHRRPPPQEEDGRRASGRLQIGRPDVHAAQAVGPVRDQLEALAIVRAADDAADDIVERLPSVRHHRVDLSALSGLPLLNVCSGDGHEVVAPDLCKASSVGHALARKPAFEQVTDHHQVDGACACAGWTRARGSSLPWRPAPSF